MNKPTSLGTLAERVRLMRDRLCTSRADLAEASGLSASSIRRIEQGQTKDPKGSAIIGIEDALGCDSTWLLNGWGGYVLPIWGKA